MILIWSALDHPFSASLSGVVETSMRCAILLGCCGTTSLTLLHGLDRVLRFSIFQRSCYVAATPVSNSKGEGALRVHIGHIRINWTKKPEVVLGCVIPLSHVVRKRIC